MRGDDVVVFSGWAAFGWVVMPAAACLVTAAFFRLLRATIERQAAQERASLQANALELRPGKVALAGAVETLDGEVDSAPVKVIIEGGKRIVDARPFLLKLANGVRVRVEPGPKPQLRDALEGKVAALTAGEIVFVRGELRAPISDTLHAARATISGRVRLSTEAFSGELDRRAKSVRDGGIVLLMIAALTQLFYGGFYLEALLYWLGRETPATIVVAFYFWVVLATFSAILGLILSAWEGRPWWSVTR